MQKRICALFDRNFCLSFISRSKVWISNNFILVHKWTSEIPYGNRNHQLLNSIKEYWAAEDARVFHHLLATSHWRIFAKSPILQNQSLFPRVCFGEQLLAVPSFDRRDRSRCLTTCQNDYSTNWYWQEIHCMDFSCCQREVETQKLDRCAMLSTKRNKKNWFRFVDFAEAHETHVCTNTHTNYSLRNYNLQKLIASARVCLSFRFMLR